MRTQEMFRSHPRKTFAEGTEFSSCIAACVDCVDTCTICADACLSEEKIQMLASCIRLDLDCADICQTTSRILARQAELNPHLLRMQLEVTMMATKLCAEECERHGEMHQHCRICASVCRACEQSCRQLLSKQSVASAISR